MGINRSFSRLEKRKGTIVVLAAFLMIILFGMFAFAVDIGYLLVVRAEAQRTADSAAMAADWEMLNYDYFAGNYGDAQDEARLSAMQYARENQVGHATISLDYNDANLSDGDVVLGRLTGNSSDPLSFDDPSGFNAVRVRISRTASGQGRVPFFFGHFLGLDSAEVQAEAIAGFQDAISGFRVTESSGDSALLPFVISEETWEEMQSNPGAFTDEWTYDTDSDTATLGSDGIPEMNMFPGGGSAEASRRGRGKQTGGEQTGASRREGKQTGGQADGRASRRGHPYS